MDSGQLKMLRPPALQPGDKVSIISPASSVRPEYIEEAAQCLRRMGFEVEIMPHALGPADGSYAADPEGRTLDLVEAFFGSDSKAVLCGRGGYGCTQLLGLLSPKMVRRNPKWLIGFSDITALHAELQARGVMSLHAPMCRHLAERGEDHEVTRLMMDILTGRAPEVTYTAPHVKGNIEGRATGVLRGGNLAVLNGLAATPYDMTQMADTILFVEDVAEPIYKVERVLWRLCHAGCFDTVGNPGALRGVVFGRFTGYEPSRDHASMEAMTARLMDEICPDLPVAMGFDFGHVERNLPLVEGCRATLDVTAAGSSLTMHLDDRT